MHLVGSKILFIVCCVHVDIDPLYTANEEICKLLKATKVPYILIYKRNEGLVTSFPCSPSKIQLLIDALHEHASPLNDDLSPCISEESEFEQLLEERVRDDGCSNAENTTAIWSRFYLEL